MRTEDYVQTERAPVLVEKGLIPALARDAPPKVGGIELATVDRSWHSFGPEERGLGRSGLVLEQDDEDVEVAHQFDGAAAKVTAIFRQTEVGEMHNWMRPSGEDSCPSGAH